MNPPSHKRKEVAELLRDPDTFGTVILSLLLQTYGEEIFDLDVLEIYARVQDDFSAVISEEGENRLNALMFALSSNAFYEDVDVFRAVATSLYDGDLGDLVGGGLEDLTIPEILWSIYEVGLLREDEPGFSNAIDRLINREIQEEAEDQDMESEHVLPYYERFLESSKEDLLEQMSRIGVSKADLMAIAKY